MALSDSELILQAKNGNDAAFEELVYRYDRSVLATALKYVQNRDEAKDIYQDVFIRIHRGLKNFEMRSEFSTWLYRVVVNYCINYQKGKKRKQFYPIAGSEPDDEKSWQKTLKGKERDPEAIILNQELSTEITGAIRQLSTKQRTVFILRHYHGHKLKEIAGIMNCSEGTVKNYLFRATQKLQHLLYEYSKN